VTSVFTESENYAIFVSLIILMTEGELQ